MLLAGLVAPAAVLILALPALAQGAPELPEGYRTIFGLSPRVVVWVIAQLQLLFAAFLLGVPIFALIAEIVGWRSGDQKYDKLAKEFTSLLPVTSAITALFGGLLAFTLLYGYPRVMTYLSGVFGPSMVVFGLLFFAEVFTLYVYYYGWDRMKQRKGLHIGLGFLLNIVGTLLMVIPNAWVTFMMSPARNTVVDKLVDSQTQAWLGTAWQAMNNPLWMPLNIHRFIGNIMFGGFVVGAYAAVRFLTSTDAASRAYYDWMGYVGNLVGIIALIPLPFAGYYMGREIYSYSPVMGNTMMGGIFSWPFVIQGVMVGLLFIMANFYLWNGMGRAIGSERYIKYIKGINVILFICFAIWLTPHNLPLSGAEQAALGGQYHPTLQFFGLMAAKNAAINFILISTFVSFMLYRRADKKAPASIRAQGAGAKLGLVLVCGLVVLVLAYFANRIWGMDPVVDLQGLDPATVAPAAVARWRAIMMPPIYLAGGMIVAAIVATVLALLDRGVIGQVLYVVCGVIASVFVLGPYGFVAMTALSPFLRDIAVVQWVITMSVLVLVTAIDIPMWRRAESFGGLRWGRIAPRAQYALLGLAVTAVMTMAWMGVIRSGLREDWHINGILRDTSPWAATPRIDSMMFVVAGIVLLFLVLVAVVFALSSLSKGKDDAGAATAGKLLLASAEGVEE